MTAFYQELTALRKSFAVCYPRRRRDGDEARGLKQMTAFYQELTALRKSFAVCYPRRRRDGDEARGL
ncbi:hypothetical protein CKJ90_33340, partial [Klebsiella pneumoniae]